ncbi:nitrate- and nitrite sensing domain-containing protein [Streptomyces sp. NPDC059629]|uniref:nitrate- and nitrite sensing domain-containing protein n=1 Tax=Streptomyces sp. NPDC059629 TaxID=3346889 RepID=UPI0036A7F22E
MQAAIIRTRLLRILVLALAVLLTLLGVAAAEQVSACRNASAAADNARLEITLQGLIHELHKERGLTTGYVGGVEEFGGKPPAQRKATDSAHDLLARRSRAATTRPPDSDVEIEGRRTSAGYLVAIVVHGLGTDVQAIAEANVRLSGTASFMAEPTRFLGHFVVGALARKRGIEVRLGEAPAAGQRAVRAPGKEPDEAQLLADSSGEPGLVGYEMAVLAERAGDLLTPTLIAGLRQALPR